MILFLIQLSEQCVSSDELEHIACTIVFLANWRAIKQGQIKNRWKHVKYSGDPQQSSL